MSRAEREDVGATRVGDAETAGESVVRHEEELEVGTRPVDTGEVHVRKQVETEHVEEVVPRRREHFDDVEHVAANEGDSGEVETLPDGSVSIPILEEELVISKRTVVRERVIVRKRTETEHRRVDAELRKERVEIDSDVELEGETGSNR